MCVCVCVCALCSVSAAVKQKEVRVCGIGRWMMGGIIDPHRKTQSPLLPILHEQHNIPSRSQQSSRVGPAV